jgi:hypothetical protein
MTDRVYNRSVCRKRPIRPCVELLEDRLVPAVFNVNSLADILNPGAGIVTLRSAIQAANSNGDATNVINLTRPGTYQITLAGTAGETDNAAGEFAILPHAGSLTIQNTSAGIVVVDGNHLARVFDINPNNTDDPATKMLVTLNGLTITNGVASPGDGPAGSGGGIRDQGNASLTLNHVTVTNNIATADGGGIAMENTVNTPWTLTVNNSVISNNHAGDAGGGIDADGSGKIFINTGTVITGNTTVNQGGGIWLDFIADGNNVLQTATLTVTGATITGNSALTGPGGGIGNSGISTVTILSSTLANNFAGTTGGGFGDQNNVGNLIVVNSLFVGNDAVGDGGGIQEGGPVTSITNTQISGNSSGARGGGIFASGITLFVNDCTIANNTAAGDTGTNQGGGGIELETTGTGLAASTITNTTITGNSALNNAGVLGGGIDALTFNGDAVLLNDTINANFAADGGGILWEGLAGSINVENTIIAGNFGAFGRDALSANRPYTDLGGNLIGVANDGNTGFTSATTQTGTVAAPLNALLAPLGYYGGPAVGAPGFTQLLQTEALDTGSPAIGKGSFLRAPAYDERGAMHLLTSSINVGAVSAIVALPMPITHVVTLMPLIVHQTMNGVENTTYFVNSTLDTHTPAAGTLTLRDAIDMANQTPGNKFIELLVPGVYNIALPGANTGTNASGAFTILPSGGNVTIANASRGAVTINGNGLDRVFDINPAADANFNDEFTVTLQGFTITGGVASPGDGGAGSGGGIRDQGIASLTLNNVAVANNIATADGGGIAMENTVNTHWVLTINNSIIANNHAGDAGGGVETDGSSKVFINGGSIVNNTCVNQGAGIWLDAIADPNNAGVFDGASLSVTGTLIRGNVAQDMLGGGIGNAGNGTVTIFGSTVENNFSGGTGGGFADSDGQGSLSVTNSLFLNNVAFADGGGIQEGGPTTTLTRSEIDGNASGATGGGVFATGTTLTVLSCTLAGNTAAGNGGSAAGGGGIELETTGPSTITTSTITGNRALNNAGVNGGGIDAQALAGALMLLNDSITSNFAAQGGGIDLGAVAGSSITLENTIVALNLAANGVDLFNPSGIPFHDQGGNLIGVAGDANAGLGGAFGGLTSTQTGTLAQPLNPLLGPLGNNGGPVIGAAGTMIVLETEAPLRGSPAHGKGVKSGAPASDERGVPIMTSVSVGAVNG